MEDETMVQAKMQLPEKARYQRHVTLLVTVPDCDTFLSRFCKIMSDSVMDDGQGVVGTRWITTDSAGK